MRHSAAILFAMGAAAGKVATPASVLESAWSPAKETFGAVDYPLLAMGQSPKPTEAPGAPGDLFGRMLMPRVDFSKGPATCGYYTSQSNSFTCQNAGQICTGQSDHIGCCYPNQPCSAIRTTCLNYSQVQAGACDLPADYHTLCCSNTTAGQCFTWTITTTGIQETSLKPFTLLVCDKVGGNGTLVTRDPSWGPEQTAATTGATTTPASSSSFSSSHTPLSTFGDSPPDEHKKKSSTPVGAIAGGVVGGVGGVALIGLAAFFFLRKKRPGTAAHSAPDSAAAAQGAMGPAPPMAGGYSPAGQPGGYQYGPLPPQPNYDPNMAYGQGGLYPPQHQYGQQQQYPPQQGYAYPAGVTVSPPPISPSPDTYKEGAVVVEQLQHQQQHVQVQELQATNPPGAESNRAELPS